MKWRPVDSESYGYLLGLYLGDGCITRPLRTTQLVISCDGRYPDIIEATADAILRTGLCQRVGRYSVRGSACIRVVGASAYWPDAFPQHGRGRKHERSIVLEAWQREIVDAHPWALLRGVLHSDGCRTVNRFATRLPSGRVAEYAYPRWLYLQPLGRHPRAVLRDLRRRRHPLDAVQSPQRVGVAPQERRAPRRARGAET